MIGFGLWRKVGSVFGPGGSDGRTHFGILPAVVRTREYGSPASYQELGDPGEAELKKQAEADVSEIYGSEHQSVE